MIDLAGKVKIRAFNPEAKGSNAVTKMTGETGRLSIFGNKSKRCLDIRTMLGAY